MKSAWMIAATTSGSGKTTVARGLMALFTQKGYKVQPFKCGPDYIDTKFHEAVCGCPSINLDTFMATTEHVRELFCRYGADADVCVVEGMMGLFDGYDRDKGSSAEIASVLDIPVVLVVDAKSAAYSMAPLLQGFANFRKDVRIVGVIYNKVGSERHFKMLQEVCNDLGIACFGYLPKDAALEQGSRYLGLDFSEEADSQTLMNLLEAHVNWRALLEQTIPTMGTTSFHHGNCQFPLGELTVLIARNAESFSFIYQETIERFGNVQYFDPENDVPDFSGTGADVTAKLYQESAIMGKYYYQIPKEKDRFGKYEITNTGVQTIKETKFGVNTYKDRRYCFAWTSENELVILAANGDANDVIWTKLNTTDMSIVAEGNLNLPEFTPDVKKYSTSGLATYRAADKKILYFFCEKNSKSTAKGVYVAVIDAATMKVESTDVNTTCTDMSGTAYGELLQHKMFLDENYNLYLPVQSQIPESETSTCAYSRILRIKAGENKFDTSYMGLNKGYNTGKIVTCDYIGNGKALLYMQNPEYTGTSDDNKKKAGWGSNYNCYYAIYDLTATTLTELQYEGKTLPYSSGNFSQRSFVLGNKVFIGTNPKDGAPTIYIYNTKDSKMTIGSKIDERYEFDRLVYIEN